MATPVETTVVPPSRIGSELDRLRKESVRISSGNNGSEKIGGTIRATLSNLIILTEAREQGGKTPENSMISQCIEKLALLHPSRFFVICVDSNLSQSLRTEIHSRTIKGTSGAITQTEEIHISVHPDSLKLLKNIILAHLVPDIETICLELSNMELLSYREQLLHVVKELIDTSISYAPYRFTESRKPQSEKEPYTSPAFRDICWSLLGKWRMLISEQYDSQEAQKLIEKISDIHIIYTNNQEENSNIPDEAISLAAWLLSSLKLFPNTKHEITRNEIQVTCTSTAKMKSQVTLHLSGVPKKGLSRISQVKIEMKLSPESSFATSCTYLPSIESIEVTSGGKGEADDTRSISGETCEFYFRRCSVQQISISEAALELIRGEKPADLFEEFEKLKSLL